MSHFNFTESMARTIAEFDNLPAASREDYFRMKEKHSSMTDTPTRKDKGKAMKPPADATHCGGYPTDTPTPDLTAPEQVERPARKFAVHSPTGVHIGLWSDGNIAADVAAESPGNTIEELVLADDYAALSAKLKAAEADRDRFRDLWHEACVRSGKSLAERDAALGVREAQDMGLAVRAYCMAWGDMESGQRKRDPRVILSYARAARQKGGEG